MSKQARKSYIEAFGTGPFECGFSDCRHPGEPVVLEYRWDQEPTLRGTVDHIVPRALGGSDDLSNLRPAHHGCNSAGGGRVPSANGDLLNTARDIAREEARRFRYHYGYGYRVVEAADLALEALTKRMEKGDDRVALVQADGTPIENPPAYLRTTIRNLGFAMARARTKEVQADISEGSDEWGWLHDSEAHASDWGNPEDEAFADEAPTIDLEAARLAVEGLVEVLPDWRQKRVARLYYLDGKEGKDISEEMNVSPQVVKHLLSAIRKALGDKEANLRAWRIAMFPEARKPRSDSAQGSPEALKAIVS